MYGFVALALIVAPAAPVPAAPVPAVPQKPGAVGEVDRNQAFQFASLVERLAQQVVTTYVREVDPNDLLEGAVRGLYEELGQAVPAEVLARVRKATAANRVPVLADIRIALGAHPRLSGLRSLFAAMNGFRHATDPSTGLVSPRVTTYASVDQDFGIGIELEGVVGTAWTLYQAEFAVASGRYPAVGWFGPMPRPEAIPAPVSFPWKVRRVIPGSPAQKAGIRPGDVITHLNGTELTAEAASRLFPGFANPQPVFDPQTGLPKSVDRVLGLRRADGTSFTAELKTGSYTPESLFGVMRLPEDRWDCLLDREYKIGYIRLGPIESGLDVAFAEVMGQLAGQGCRALILDLRWCPGGYVDPGTRIAGLFLREGSVIARMDYRNPSRAGSSGELRVPPGGGKYAELPLVLLVGQETTGGGELIASALRDNDDGSRCVVVGQRSVGRAAIQSTIDAGFAGVQFRLTTGTSLRPNGKNRLRRPDSQPTDDWGIRPDPGLEVPVTPDKSAELRRQAELHSLRPFDNRQSLPFDDPAADPYRLTALTYLRKKLGPPK
jgi:carboxyl-terminal processing protease